METEAAPNEIPENPIAPVDVDVDQNHETPVSEMPNHEGPEAQPNFSIEEVRDALETSASMGKFWLDWEKLRSIMSYYLKQVLLEYPESEMTLEQQMSSLGETFLELVKRLDEALQCFDEGPPFTLQRLCEILLTARSIYPKLSKLSLALEKNLLVTSTLTISTDPYPHTTTKQSSNGSNETAQPQTSSVENGVEPSPDMEDRDEVMADIQEPEEVAKQTEEETTEPMVGDEL